MKSKLLRRISNLVGLGTERSAPPPEYLLITDGLVVTTQRAVAWYSIATSNTDQESQEKVDIELRDVIASVAPMLAGYDCQLKIIWGFVDGDGYLESLKYDPTIWDDKYADYLDNFEIADRHLLLGVVIDDNRQGEGNVSARARQQSSTALGLPAGRVTPKEQAYYAGLAISLGKNLNSTRWSVKITESETLMWMISREMHRNTVLPRPGMVTGSSLATLTAGRLVPYSDHLVALDEQGQPQRYIAVLPLADFPMELTTGGQQEWLRRLSVITRVDGEGNNIVVTADASIRWRSMAPREANKAVDNARTLAKEQRQSAAQHAAGDTTLEFQETEQEMEQARRDLNTRGMVLIEAHPRIILSEPTKADLDEAVAATTSHFSKMGITASRGADEQRELWLETLPGDQTRVADMYQIMESEAFFGSWFWGGSKVGESDGAPMAGHQTGSTPGIVRHSLTSGSKRGDATTTLYLGKSGRGKTTALMLGEISAAMDARTWITHIAIKGDELSLVPYVRDHLGVPAGLVTLNAEHSGSADLFRSLDRDAAITAVASQIQLLAPDHLRAAAQSAAIVVHLEAEQAEQEGRSPQTWHAIQRMVTHEREDIQMLGQTLEAFAQTRLGAPVLGRPRGSEALRSEPGLWMIELPDLQLPGEGKQAHQWTDANKQSIAVVRAIALHCLAVSRRSELREMSKLVAIPEVHRIIGTEDGADFLNQVAMMGRALGTNLAIDTQDAVGLLKVRGVMEQISTLFCFQLTSPVQQDAAAEMLGIEPGPDARATIQALADDPDNPEGLRKGHALVRDFRGRVATMQFVIPDEHAEIQLNTNPDADRLRHEYDAQFAHHTNGHSEQDTAPDLVQLPTA